MRKLVYSLIMLMFTAMAFAQNVQDVLKENQDLYESFFEESQERVEKEARELAATLKKTKASELKEAKA